MGFGSSVGEGGLRKRIRFYFHPGRGQKKNQRINEWLKETCGLRISFVTIPDDQKARDLERELRAEYEKEHREFPPWDRNA